MRNSKTTERPKGETRDLLEGYISMARGRIDNAHRINLEGSQYLPQCKDSISPIIDWVESKRLQKRMLDTVSAPDRLFLDMMAYLIRAEALEGNFVAKSAVEYSERNVIKRLSRAESVQASDVSVLEYLVGAITGAVPIGAADLVDANRLLVEVFSVSMAKMNASLGLFRTDLPVVFRKGWIRRVDSPPS